MNFGESFHIWRTRWKLTFVLLVLALAGAGVALRAGPRSYQSESSVVLLASRSAARLNGGNPYLSFSPSLSLTADAVSRELMAPGTIQSLAAMGFAGSYTVTLPTSTTPTTGSVLLVTVTASQPAAAQGTLNAVTRQIRIKLLQLQGAVKRRNQVRAATLSYSPQATLNVGAAVRPVVAVLALGLLLALGLPIVADGRVARRRLMKSAALAPETGSGHAVQPAGRPASTPTMAEAGQQQPDYLARSRNGALHSQPPGRARQSAEPRR
jgi:hypothetical protein